MTFQKSENYMKKYFWDKKMKKESYEGFHYNNEV